MRGEVSPYERVRCGICNTRLTRTNCDWKFFPGICHDCAPDDIAITASGRRRYRRENPHVRTLWGPNWVPAKWFPGRPTQYCA